MPNMVIRAQTPRKLEILKFLSIISSVWTMRLKWALNHYQAIIFSQDIEFIPIFAILGTLWGVVKFALLSPAW